MLESLCWGAALVVAVLLRVRSRPARLNATASATARSPHLRYGVASVLIAVALMRAARGQPLRRWSRE